ncbi:hypothetical protein [Lacinutrix mariniflava]|uniref:hypothetical protein n=1 Tax=Lacinutrix mariniflava TaxID=342955 RepID=UPI000A5BA248|nr:hypothetical protein [Lacinutrix mariniflava]
MKKPINNTVNYIEFKTNNIKATKAFYIKFLDGNSQITESTTLHSQKMNQG